MANSPLNFFDYVKAAFHQKVNIPGMGHLPLNKIFLGLAFVLGIGNPGFWFLGLALELGYLWGLANHEGYRKVVQSSLVGQKTEEWGQKQSIMLASLDMDSRDRYHRLLDTCSSIIKVAVTDGHEFKDFQSSGLSQLVWLFLRLLYSRKKMKSIISTTSMPDLQAEIKEISGKIAKEPEGAVLRRSLQGTLDIQNRRLENLVKTQENLKVVDSELDRIEKQVTLLNEEASVSSDPEVLSVRLDTVMDSLTGTSKWMSEQSDLFGTNEDVSLPDNLIHRTLEKRETQ
jgi:hypothetical protein